MKTHTKNTIFDFAKMTEKEVREFPEALVARIQKSYKEIKSLSREERTFENTFLALEYAIGDLGDRMHQIGLLSQVSTSKSFRDTASQTDMRLSSLMVDIGRDKEIFHALKEYKEGNYKKEKKSLSADSIKLFEDSYKAFVKMGFDLPEKTEKILKKKLKRVSRLCISFSKNINDYTDFILVSSADLEGLPESYKASLPREGNMYKVDLSYPALLPFMKLSPSREKRKELAYKNMKKGGKKNLTLLSEILSLRQEISSLLGFPLYSDFKVSDRMAKDHKTVDSFVSSLTKKVLPLARKEKKDLEDFAKEKGLPSLDFYDAAYVTELLRKEKFAYDSEYVREFFETEKVLSKMFAYFGNLFGFSVVSCEAKLWHKDVLAYEVKDTKTKKLLSYLLLDLYPREGKYGHAAAFDTRYAVPKIVTLVCNFAQKTKKAPSLLSLGEVETLFHEFGHALHFMLSETHYESHNGFNVAWDFVETPSQFLENFLWSDKSLSYFSEHYTTGKPLPKDLRVKILTAKDFRAAEGTLAQLLYARLDLDLHTKDCGAPHEYYQKLYTEFWGSSIPKEHLFPASFGHLMGYDAGYYSYLWALVYAKDFFSLFEEKGFTDKGLGKRYRDLVLKPGSSIDETKIAQNFLGRKLSTKAFLKSIGL